MRYEYSQSPEQANEWRPVVGYEGIYEVSSLGHVRRVVGNGGGFLGMVLAVQIRGEGKYPIVYLSKGGKCTVHTLHKVVARAFLGVRPEGMQVNHKDYNKLNPAASNLEYVTPSRNATHAYEHGRRAACGTQKPIAKLTDDLAREIYQSAEQSGVLAVRLGVSPATINDVRNGRTWKHVTLETTA